MTAQDSILEAQGVVSVALPGAKFKVLLDSGVEILAHLAGRLRQNKISILPGDHVRVEMSVYDLKQGRIVFRYKKSP